MHGEVACAVYKKVGTRLFKNQKQSYCALMIFPLFVCSYPLTFMSLLSRFGAVILLA